MQQQTEATHKIALDPGSGDRQARGFQQHGGRQADGERHKDSASEVRATAARPKHESEQLHALVGSLLAEVRAV